MPSLPGGVTAQHAYRLASTVYSKLRLVSHTLLHPIAPPSVPTFTKAFAHELLSWTTLACIVHLHSV